MSELAPPADDDLAPPLPRWVLGSLIAALGGLLAFALVIAVAMPTLRQGRLLEAAHTTCLERTEAAHRRLERSPAVNAALAERRARSEERAGLLLQADDEGPVIESLEAMVEVSRMRADEVRLGTVREGEVLSTVAGTLRVRGDRTDLPPFLDTFYAQRRVVRLTALDLDVPDGKADLRATLRWEFAAPMLEPREVEDTAAEFAPPRLVARSSMLAVDAFNRGRWSRLEESAGALLALAPALQELARLEAEAALLDRQHRALARWQSASLSEARAVQRKLPALFRRLDVSAVGRAGLRPGPGGALQVHDGEL